MYPPGLLCGQQELSLFSHQGLPEQATAQQLQQARDWCGVQASVVKFGADSHYFWNITFLETAKLTIQTWHLKDFFFFRFIYFYWKEKQRQIFHLLIHSQSDHNS